MEGSLYRRFFPILKLQNDYSTKNFPHLAFQNSLQLMRTVLAVGNPKNIVREKCFTIIRVCSTVYCRSSERAIKNLAALFGD